jgi:alpha-mannosidase
MSRCALVWLALSLFPVVNAYGQEMPVWQIGEFNSSSAEFSTQQAPGRPFIVSESKPADWLGVQKAVVSRNAETRQASRTIRFVLQEDPAGTYRLKLGLIMLTPRLPVVEVEVNGHRGRFNQRLADFREGNMEGAILPQYSVGSLSVDIPASFLQSGQNEIGLTALTDPASTALPGGENVETAALTYDALQLVQLSQAKADSGVTDVEVTPTVFFKRESGRLAEVVSLIVRWNNLPPKGEVTLALPGWKRTEPFTNDREFGEEKFEFLVPEFVANSRAHIMVSANGREYSYSRNLTPARKWTVYLVPHEHLDVGYSDFQTKLAELHSRVINEAMDMTAEHPEFRFTLDGYWQAQQFLEGRTEADKQKFYAAVRDRKIFVPAQHSVILTGFPTAEALLRSLYGSYKFNRDHGGPWDSANITDVPSYTWSYASIMAAAGLKYFSAAANADRGPTLMLGNLHRQSPFWWEGPDGGRVLMWYARHYHQIGSEFGLPPAIATGYEGLASFLNVYERPDYTSNAVMLHGSQWENTSLFPQAELVKQWNGMFAFPELKYSGFGEAIEQIAAGSKGNLPVVRGDGGPYWEDGIASDAYHAAMERENERRAVSAEKLATIASLVDTRFEASRIVLGEMWNNIHLMDEHTWGWGRSITEPLSEDSTRELAYKRLRGTVARDLIEYQLDRAMTAITGQIDTPSRALVVFNTLNWKRNGWVEFDLQKTRELVDIESRQLVRFEVLHDEPGYQRIRFFARDIPSMGYRTYFVRDKELAAAPEQVQQEGQSVQPQIIENSYYRVVVDPDTGGIKSILDKELNRELVDTSSPFRFNQYVYVTGGDEFPNQLLTYRKWSPVPKLESHAAGNGKLISVSKTPDGTVMRLESNCLNTHRISTEIILFDNEKKIELINRVQKDLVYKKEAAYFAFPIAVKRPQFNYEIQNGVVDPARDMIPGAGREWFSSQNWISVGAPGLTVGLVNKDSFLWTFGDIVRGTWPTEFAPKNATAFSYVMNNYWNTNYIAAQGGELTFRYVLTSTWSQDQAALSRMGWEETTPLERTLFKAQDRAGSNRGPLPATTSSFLQVNNPSVVISTWKPAEDGAGSILRFIELSGSTGNMSVVSPLLKGASVQACNAMEDCKQAIPGDGNGFSLGVGPRQIVTVRIRK